MQFISENHLCDCVDVFTKILVKQKRLRHLQIVQVLQDGLNLIFKYFVELLPGLVAAVSLVQLLNAVNEELEFF